MASTSFLAIYRDAAGRTQVPAAFHTWCALSLIGAAVADRVGLYKLAGALLTPNCYTLLVGPSGVGKGHAISMATKLAAGIPSIRTYSGNVTKQALVKQLSRAKNKKKPEPYEPAKMWLVATELADDIPPGPLGEELIRFLTKVYEGDLTSELHYATVTRGDNIIRRPCINALLGTTKEWMLKSIPPDAVRGGFVARVLTIAYEGIPERIYEPEYPANRDELIERLMYRLGHLATLSGTFAMTGEAKDVHRHWYLGRPEPEDDRERPFFQREDDHIRKLMMLLALSEWREKQPLTIKLHHFSAARLLLDSIRPNILRMIKFASMNVESEHVERAAEAIKKVGILPHTALQRILYYHGVRAKELNEEILPTLKDAGRIKQGSGPKGGRVYVWTDKRKIKWAMPEDDEDD